MPSGKIILGIDPGTTIMGFGLIEMPSENDRMTFYGHGNYLWII